LYIDFFDLHPEKSWEVIVEIFYDFFDKAKPNAAHLALAYMEKKGYLHAVITQNIDNLHQEAGSKTVYEFHGNSKMLLCRNCNAKYSVNKSILKTIPPVCEKCKSILKPDFIFFGETIPEQAMTNSFEESEKADLVVIVGTTGEVQPAAMVPFVAKRNGAKIIEVNTTESNYTDAVTDIFLHGKAGEIMGKIQERLKQKED